MSKHRRTASAIEKHAKARRERALARFEFGTDGGPRKHDPVLEHKIAAWLTDHKPTRLPPPRIFRARR